MNKDKLLERIEIKQNVLVGKPVIKGTRLSVEFILNLLANGQTIDELINEYSGITFDDVLACLLFASKTLEDNTFLPLKTPAT